MRIWDVQPGYLNRQSLLGEHRELHALVAVLADGARGYARHPETLRWSGYGWALRQRHRLLAAEMALRGYVDRTPVRLRARRGEWPPTYVDEPARQLELLASKYRSAPAGRIPLPRNEQELWSHHKYSVLARDAGAYRRIGRGTASGRADYASLARELVERLHEPPEPGGLRNALEHMWSHVSRHGRRPGASIERWSSRRLLRETQRRAVAAEEPYLLRSTALSELMVWV